MASGERSHRRRPIRSGSAPLGNVRHDVARAGLALMASEYDTLVGSGVDADQEMGWLPNRRLLASTPSTFAPTVRSRATASRRRGPTAAATVATVAAATRSAPAAGAWATGAPAGAPRR